MKSFQDVPELLQLSQEFFEIYNLNVISIPTNQKMIRKDWNDKIFRTDNEKRHSNYK